MKKLKQIWNLLFKNDDIYFEADLKWVYCKGLIEGANEQSGQYKHPHASFQEILKQMKMSEVQLQKYLKSKEIWTNDEIEKNINKPKVDFIFYNTSGENIDNILIGENLLCTFCKTNDFKINKRYKVINKFDGCVKVRTEFGKIFKLYQYNFKNFTGIKNE